MTWKEFKDKVEKAGVKDTDEIDYFDFSIAEYADVYRIYEHKNDRWTVAIH